MQTDQGDRGTASLYNQTGLNTPASTYLFSILSFRSSPQATSATDLANFSASLKFYSPQVSGLGVTSSFSATGANTDTWRGGLYFVHGNKFGQLGFLLVHHLLISTTSADKGQVQTLWNLSYAGGLLSSNGAATYTWDNLSQSGVATTSFNPTISIRIYQGLRIAALYTHTIQGESSIVTKGLGFELYQAF